MSENGNGAVIIDYGPDDPLRAVMTKFRFWRLFLSVR